jgi:hypothetical protein
MSVSGSWELVINSPMGKQQVAVEFEQDDDRLGGTLVNRGNGMRSEIFDGSVAGDQVCWKAKLQQLRLTLAFTTTVVEDTISGKVKAGVFGNFDVSGHRA